MFSYVLGRFQYILSVLRLFSQKKHLKVPSSVDLMSDICGYISPRGPIVLQSVSNKTEFYQIKHLLIGFPPLLFISCFCSFLTKTKH